MAPGWHVSCSADEQAQKMKDEKRCVDAWVNEDGHCVVKLNRKQLKAEYDNVVNIMRETIKSSNEPVEVNYACNEIICYANDTSRLSDFTYTFIVLPECCTAVQAYSGIPFDELRVTIKFIYQPTGEVMFNLQVYRKGNSRCKGSQRDAGRGANRGAEDRGTESGGNRKTGRSGR